MTNRNHRFLGGAFAHFGCLLAGALLISQSAMATQFLNPFPGVLEDDIDGTGLFSPEPIALSTEFLDVFDTSAEFGFFTSSDPGTLVPIFEAGDLTGESALIDFATGYVFDVEDAAGQNVFSPVSDPIGFYLDLPGIATLYSVPEMNFGGLDGFGAYRTVGGDDFNLMFLVPGTAPTLDSLLSWHTVSGLTPVAAQVPTPMPLALIGVGIVLFGAKRIRRNS